MQHDVITTTLQILSAAGRGVPWLDRHGFTVVPLHASGVAVRGSRLRVEEMAPPRADRITAVNDGAAPCMLAGGSLLRGGWADRVVGRSRQIPAGAVAEVGVEVVSARWWRQGELRLTERLEPSEHALLLLMDGGGSGLRSMARTALWTAMGDLDPDGRPRPGNSEGWMLLDGERLLAATLILAISEPSDTIARRAATAGVFADALERPARLEPRLRRLGGGAIEVTLVSHALDIPDAVIRGAHRSRF